MNDIDKLLYDILFIHSLYENGPDKNRKINGFSFIVDLFTNKITFESTVDKAIVKVNCLCIRFDLFTIQITFESTHPMGVGIVTMIVTIGKAIASETKAMPKVKLVIGNDKSNSFQLFCCKREHLKGKRGGPEPWSCGYRRRLKIKRS